MFRAAFLSIFTILFLTGCVSREQADAKLASGCAAGAELFIEENYEIKEIVSKAFGKSSLGNGYRDVRIDVIETDGWHEVEKDYKCIFFENYALFGMGYTATIEQIKLDDQIYGKDGDKILGSLQDHLKLMETVDKALFR